jgi:hypothetical protein
MMAQGLRFTLQRNSIVEGKSGKLLRDVDLGKHNT